MWCKQTKSFLAQLKLIGLQGYSSKTSLSNVVFVMVPLTIQVDSKVRDWRGVGMTAVLPASFSTRSCSWWWLWIYALWNVASNLHAFEV